MLVNGRGLSDEVLDQIYPFYERTFFMRGNSPYLNRAFFEEIRRTLPDGLAVVLAEGGGRPVATPPQPVRPTDLAVKDGFVAELVYEVPRATQGSWVSLTTDAKGRLIASDQADKGLWRITPAAIGVDGATTKVEKIDVDIGGDAILPGTDAYWTLLHETGHAVVLERVASEPTLRRGDRVAGQELHRGHPEIHRLGDSVSTRDNWTPASRIWAS